MRRRVLVTGGAGFVGRTLVRSLYNDHDVCVLDTLEFGDDRFDDAEAAKFILHRIDIRDGARVKAAVDDFRPDALIHLAALHFIPDCEKKPGEATSVNVVGTANLLAACPPECRFVLASTGAVYSPSEALHHETRSELGPRDVYGFTKLHAEDYLRYAAQARKLPAVAVRLFNVIGPGETNPHLMPELVAQLKAGRPTVRLGNTWPKRDYIDVRDAASGFAAAALGGSVAPGEVVTVNLGTSRQYSVAEIVERLKAVSGISFTVEQDADRVRPVDRPFLGADVEEIRRRFDWAPRYDLEEALQNLWREPDLSYNLRLAYGLSPSFAE